MNTQLESYWPADFKVETGATPLTILKSQAALLGEQTNNVVKGAVQTVPDEEGSVSPTTDTATDASGEEDQLTSDDRMRLRHSLYLCVPSLGGYRYFLLNVRENPGTYPVKIFDSTATKWYEAGDLEEFKGKLREILSSERVRRRIAILLNYASSGSKN